MVVSRTGSASRTNRADFFSGGAARRVGGTAVYACCVDVVLQYFNDCPNWRQAAAHLDALTDEFRELVVTLRPVETAEEAERVGFRGSPSILVDGVDPFGPDDAPVGLSCRVFLTPDGPAGSPTIAQLRDALVAAR